MMKHLGLSIILAILGNALQSLAFFSSTELSYTGFPVLSNGNSKGKSPHPSCEEHKKGNGRCDDRNNDIDCEWDGGDCCPCSCENGDRHSCGAQGYNCQDPDYIDCVGTSAPSGAPTSTPTETPSPAKTLIPATTEAPTPGPTNYPTPIPAPTEVPKPTPSTPPTATPIQTSKPAPTYPPIPISTTTPPVTGPTSIEITSSPDHYAPTVLPSATQTPAPINTSPTPTPTLNPEAPPILVTPPTTMPVVSPTKSASPPAIMSPTPMITPYTLTPDTTTISPSTTSAPAISPLTPTRSPEVPSPTQHPQPPTIAPTPVLITYSPVTHAPTSLPVVSPIQSPPESTPPIISPTKSTTPTPIPLSTSPSSMSTISPTAPSPTIWPTFSPSEHLISPTPYTSSISPAPTSGPTSTPTCKVHVNDYPTSAPTIPSLEECLTTTPTTSPTTIPLLTASAMAQSRTMAFWAILIAAVSGIAASILDAHLSRETGNSSQALQSTVPAIGSMNIRRPSSTLGYILTSQLQFLATLSLVEYYTTEDEPWLHEFGARLRWLNLWWPASFAGDEIFQGYAEQRRLASSSTCDWEDPAFFVPIGNLALVAAILLFILLVHLLVISGLEAYWLLEKHANEEWERAESDFEVRSPASDLQRVLPVADTDQSRSCDTTTIDAGTASVSTRWVTPTADNEAFERKEDRDQEEGILVDNRPRYPIANPVIECRDQSSSAWLHFPHVELVFLFFAFEGFVAAQVYGFQKSQCLSVQIVAAVVLILYPVLMFIGICRITLVRVCSTAIIEFRWFPNRQTRCNGCISLCFISWKHDQSLFSWGDKGRWHTVQTSNECLWRERNWFRVGFGPIFVDVTQSGSWLMAIVLLEWTSFACISVLVESGTVQLFSFFGLFLGAFVMLVISRPFANKAMNVIALLVTFINAATMALLAVSTVGWSITIEVTGIYGVVALMQLMVLLVLVVPIYVDLMAVIIAAICKTHHIGSQETSPRNEKHFVRGYIRRLWMRTWCNMLGRNLCAYMKDIREGVRNPRVLLERVKSCTYLGPAPCAAGAQERVEILLCDTRLDDEDTKREYEPASNSSSSDSSAASSRLSSLRQSGRYPPIVPAQEA